LRTALQSRMVRLAEWGNRQANDFYQQRKQSKKCP